MRRWGIGHSGGCSIQRFYGYCQKCGKKAKLSGYLCKNCYNSIYYYKKYHSNKEFRKRRIKQVKAWRKKKREAKNGN